MRSLEPLEITTEEYDEVYWGITETPPSVVGILFNEPYDGQTTLIVDSCWIDVPGFDHLRMAGGEGATAVPRVMVRCSDQCNYECERGRICI